MKQPTIASALFFLIALLSSVAHGEPQPADSGPSADMQVSGDATPCVRLRSGPRIDRGPVDCLEQGTRLRVLGKISGWSHVRLLDGTEGWVDSSYVEPAPMMPTDAQTASPSPAEPPGGGVRSGPPAAPPKTASPRQVSGKADPCVRTRSGPGIDRPPLDCLEPGTRLSVIGSRSNWSQVRLSDGTEGWVDTSYLEGVSTQFPGPAAVPRGQAGPADELQGQIAALQGQLQALSARRAATEERLRKTVVAAEAAQNEASRLRQRVQQLESATPPDGRMQQLDEEVSAMRAHASELEEALAAAENQVLRAAALNAEQERRIEMLDSSVAEGKAREAQQQQALATVEDRLRVAEQTAVQQAARIVQLEAAPPPDVSPTANLERQLEEVSGQLRRAKETNAQQTSRLAELEAALPSAQSRENELGQALAAAEDRLRAAAETSAHQAARIVQLEAAPPPDTPRAAHLKRQLKEVKAQLRSAEETSAQQSNRLTELEAALPSAQSREAELRQALAAAEDRRNAAERRGAEQAQRIEELSSELAVTDARVAEAQLKSRLTSRPEQARPQAVAGQIKVRTPIVAAPEPPKVSVRMPAAMETEDLAGLAKHLAEELAEEAPPATDAAVDAVQAWAAAWSDQRVDDYLSFYAPGFQPPDGLSRAEWEGQRRQRLSRPSYIRVTISALRAEQTDDGTVTATFRQDYESDKFADTVTKELTLAADNGTWRLVAEQTTP